MAVQRNADGSIDKRTKEGKAMLERMAKARKAAAAAKKKTEAKSAPIKKSASTVKKTASGKVDKRTKEGKEICERMAKARKAQNSLTNRLKRLFK